MSSGEGVEEQEVPAALVEIEVEAEPGDNNALVPVEAERTRGNVESALSSPRPLYPNRFPFRTAKGFGNWVYSKLATTPEEYHAVYSQFLRYCTIFRIKKLVKIGKRVFHDYDRLCFYQGLSIIAVSTKQRSYVRRMFVEEFKKMWSKSSME